MPYASAALFDLDHTLLKVNCSFAFGIYLYQRGVLKTPRMIYLAASYLQHKTHFISTHQLHLRSFRSLFEGMYSVDLALLVDQWLGQQWESLLYRPLIAELKNFQSKEVFTAVLSNSPDFIVEPIARLLQVDDWIATHYGKNVEGKLCRIENLIEGKEKGEYLDLLSVNKSIPRNSIAAYSDSFLDVPFLEKAGKPIAVRPDRKLKTLCKKMHWEIRL